MKVPLLDLREQYHEIREEVEASVARVMESQHFILGPEVEALEQTLAARVGVEHAVGCASGTDALLLALRALDLEAGAEVVVPTFTFFATAGAVWNAGLRPVFADVDPATYNLTRATVEAALSERARAIVVVHLFGQMAPMGPILALAEERGLAVIEDAAQSIDARQRIDGEWRAAGSLGRAGCFSFFPSKNLGGAGDGGLITTDDDALAERLRKLRVHGGLESYRHEVVGTNSRLDAVQAAVLRAKLPYLEQWTGRRRENAARYDVALGDVAGVATPVVAAGNEHVYNQYTIRVAERDRVRRELEDAGIGTGLYYPIPLHLQACFAGLGYGAGDLPVAERASEEALSLPVYPELTAAQQTEVIGRVAAAVEALDTNE